MAKPRTVAMLALLLAVARGEVDRRPQPHNPADSVIYPKDFCKELSKSDKFDFIVVGSGPAGSTVARRLAEIESNRVLLLEAGGEVPLETDLPGNLLNDPKGEKIWNIVTENNGLQCLGMLGDRCKYTNGKMLGGCSNINYMMYVRGNRKDYDEVADLGNPGWSYKEVLPYFKKLENYQAAPITSRQSSQAVSSEYHSGDGPFTAANFALDPKTHPFKQAFTKALKKMNISINSDINGKSQMGFSNLAGMVETDSYRNNIAKSYLLNIPDNLKVCYYATVYKVLLSKKVAEGVEFLYKPLGEKMARTIQVQARKETLIAGGPLNTPQILERSGIGRSDIVQNAGVTLVHELPGVGENLYDQFIDFGVAFTVDYITEVETNPLSIKLTSFTGFLNVSDPSSDSPDIQVIFQPYTPGVGKALFLKPRIKKQLDAQKNLLFVSPIILRQISPGYVHIRQSISPGLSPDFNPNQFTSRAEVEMLAKSSQLIREIMKSPALARFKPKPYVINECKLFKFGSRDEVMCGARHLSVSLYHLVGTTSMGPKSNRNSVVDTELKVHGIKNLRVVDLSVLPLVPRGNTEIPTIMVAERAADLIKLTYNQPINKIGGQDPTENLKKSM